MAVDCQKEVTMTRTQSTNTISMSALADDLSYVEDTSSIIKKHPRKKTNQPKTEVGTLILKILLQCSSSKKHLTQFEISQKLFRLYNVSLERRAISRHIQTLIDLGFNIREGNGVWVDLTADGLFSD